MTNSENKFFKFKFLLFIIETFCSCNARDLNKLIFSLKTTLPWVGLVLPVTTSMKVVFPAPFGPTMACKLLGGTVKDKLFKALKPSKLTVTPSIYKIELVFLIILSNLAFPSIFYDYKYFLDHTH